MKSKRIKTRNVRVLNEGKIADFFGKMFKTKKFLAAQKDLEKQKKYKEHPLMEVADKMIKELHGDSQSLGNDYKVRFTNVDVENDGYPQTFSANYDCIAVKEDPSDPHDRSFGPIDKADKKALLDLAKKCGLPDGYTFYDVTDYNGFGVIAKIPEQFGITHVNESDSEFQKIDDIVKFLNDKDVDWKKVYKTARIEAKQSDGGEEVETIGSDGNKETARTTKKGDWIVNNVSNKENKWIIDDNTFKKKYEKTSKEGIYKPKGGVMMCAPIADYCDTGVTFAPPNWGGDTISIRHDGYFMRDVNNEKDIYAISKKDFDSTYSYKKPSLEESAHKHTRKQILESIKYWEKQLKAGNYKKDSTLDESFKISLADKQSATKALLDHNDELTDFIQQEPRPTKDELIDFVANIFKEEGLDTPWTRQFLIKLKMYTRDWNDAVRYLWNARLKGQGLGLGNVHEDDDFQPKTYFVQLFKSDKNGKIDKYYDLASVPTGELKYLASDYGLDRKFRVKAEAMQKAKTASRDQAIEFMDDPLLGEEEAHCLAVVRQGDDWGSNVIACFIDGKLSPQVSIDQELELD